MAKLYKVRDADRLQLVCPACEWTGPAYRPGIFKVWRPKRIEKIVPESLRARPDRDGHTWRCRFEGELVDAVVGSELWKCVEDCPHVLKKKGVTPVYVPDDDPDHRGTVYDDYEEGNGGVEENDRGEHGFKP